MLSREDDHIRLAADTSFNSGGAGEIGIGPGQVQAGPLRPDLTAQRIHGQIYCDFEMLS